MIRASLSGKRLNPIHFKGLGNPVELFSLRLQGSGEGGKKERKKEKRKSKTIEDLQLFQQYLVMVNKSQQHILNGSARFLSHSL